MNVHRWGDCISRHPRRKHLNVQRLDLFSLPLKRMEPVYLKMGNKSDKATNYFVVLCVGSTPYPPPKCWTRVAGCAMSIAPVRARFGLLCRSYVCIYVRIAQTSTPPDSFQRVRRGVIIYLSLNGGMFQTKGGGPNFPRSSKTLGKMKEQTESKSLGTPPTHLSNVL